MIRNIFNRISNALRRQRYQKLYRRLFWHYAEKYSTAHEAGVQAADAFFSSPGMSGRNGYLIPFRR